MSTAAPPELHLPGLPEVHLGGAIGVGGGAAPDSQAPERRSPGQVLRQLGMNYLPLLLMALLALGTGWLVKNSPQPSGPAGPAAQREAPDYTMQGFSVTRFDASGRVALRIDGDVMRHYPATDRLEIEAVRILATAPDGRTTRATAQRALSNGDGSEVQLLGNARVVSQLPGEDELVVQGEFLHAFLRFEQLRSHLPVQVTRGGMRARAGSLDYDHGKAELQLGGPVRAQWWPGQRQAPPEAAAAPRP